MTARATRRPVPGWRARAGAAVVLLASAVMPITPAAPAGAAPAPVAPTASAANVVPGAPGCPIFPADNIWHYDISSLPVNPRSNLWLSNMGGPSQLLHPDFGPSGNPSAPYGMPYNVVPDTHAKVTVGFRYGSESDAGPYPFGPDTVIEGGSDAHALMLDKDTCTLYELFAANWNAGQPSAGSGAIWDLRSDALRPSGWTSADAAGLPILPGILRWDEVQSGTIDHAIRFTTSATDTSFLWPARHEAGSASNPALPPMGVRFRLKAGFDISHYSAYAQVILRAMQHYGLILADNGSDWYFQGSADPAWPDALVEELKTIPAGAFEAVDESFLMADANSGQVGPPPTSGYILAAADGGIFTFGNATFRGAMGGHPLVAPIVGMAETPDQGGYWLVASDGGIFSFGDATFSGSMGGHPLDAPIVGMTPTPSGHGYWLVASDGGIFSFGDATFSGSMGGRPLVAPITGITSSATGHGYRMVAADGGIFSFGDAVFYGSIGGHPLARPVVGMTSTASGHGYWMVASDGGIFAFGDAAFRGSTGAIHLDRPVVAMTRTPSGSGYWLTASDGGIFAFGDARFWGSTGGVPLVSPVVAMGGTG